VGKLSSLTLLNLSKTELTDEGIPALMELSQLRSLDVGKTAITHRALGTYHTTPRRAIFAPISALRTGECVCAVVRVRGGVCALRVRWCVRVCALRRAGAGKAAEPDCALAALHQRRGEVLALLDGPPASHLLQGHRLPALRQQRHLIP